MFRDLSNGDLPLFSLNFGVITLIPIPICLLNVSYKICLVATLRLNSVADKGWSFFMKQYMNYIEENRGVILKLDFEKAYDKVRWPFLFQTLRMKGFSSKWISWIETCLPSPRLMSTRCRALLSNKKRTRTRRSIITPLVQYHGRYAKSFH
ncbi:hypothetical protein U9M48_025387 [Paspalum notatum var. saurae]|uniref:Reverse transcriptase domain-containing protein n=1 Tax=Paspalum notatum var. saurae TaxID=547442 RepID=A0AAQ3TSF0_PASNO